MQVADVHENTIAQKLQGNFQSTGLLQGRCFLGTFKCLQLFGSLLIQCTVWYETAIFLWRTRMKITHSDLPDPSAAAVAGHRLFDHHEDPCPLLT